MIARFLAWVRRRRHGGYWRYVRTETIQERAAKIRPGFIKPCAIFTTRPVYRWVPLRKPEPRHRCYVCGSVGPTTTLMFLGPRRFCRTCARMVIA